MRFPLDGPGVEPRARKNGDTKEWRKNGDTERMGTRNKPRVPELCLLRYWYFRSGSGGDLTLRVAHAGLVASREDRGDASAQTERMGTRNKPRVPELCLLRYWYFRSGSGGDLTLRVAHAGLVASREDRGDASAQTVRPVWDDKTTFKLAWEVALSGLLEELARLAAHLVTPPRFQAPLRVDSMRQSGHGRKQPAEVPHQFIPDRR